MEAKSWKQREPLAGKGDGAKPHLCTRSTKPVKNDLILRKYPLRDRGVPRALKCTMISAKSASVPKLAWVALAGCRSTPASPQFFQHRTCNSTPTHTNVSLLWTASSSALRCGL
jgi:hypothetical protein